MENFKKCKKTLKKEICYDILKKDDESKNFNIKYVKFYLFY